MIKNEVVDYPKLYITTEGGGRVTICNFSGTVDIGLYSSVNPHGLGGSSYIRNKDDIDNKIKSVKETVWLSEEEKKACIDFLEGMK